MFPGSGFSELSGHVHRMIDENNDRKRRAAAVIDGIQPCRKCGHKMRFVPGPPEGSAVCSHSVELLESQCAGDVSTGRSPDLFSWKIYLENGKMWGDYDWPEELKDEDEPRPDLDTRAGAIVALVGIVLLILFAAVARGADVRDFGAIGDGEADDTEAIQAAADVCSSMLRSIEPPGGSYMGTCPELFFPAGKYKLSSEIELNGYQVVRGEDAILIQDPGKRILVFDGCYRNRVESIQFLGGTRQISFSNVNVDMTRLTIRGCTFQDWTEVAIAAEGTGPDLHLSATILIEECVFDGGTILATRADSTTLRSCRHQFRGACVTHGTPSIVNLWTGGVLYLTDFTGTPACPEADQIRARWIDNFGSVVIDGSRFGGEGGGLPIVFDHGPPNVVNPWIGRKIVVQNSQVSCGRNLWPEAALITMDGLPQCVRITGCHGLTSNTVPLIKIADGYDMAGAIADVTLRAKPSLVMYAITIQGNHVFAPTPVPGPLQPFLK